MSSIIVYIFHRDLRLPDHYGLEKAAELAKIHNARILPCFFFTPAQVVRNHVKSVPAVEFMITSLMELQDDLQKSKTDLLVLYGSNKDCLHTIHKVLGTNLVGIVDVRDYTPFAKQRIQEFKQFASSHSILYEDVSDVYLAEPGTVLNGSGNMYQKFTPFWMQVKDRKINTPRPKINGPYVSKEMLKHIGRESCREISLQDAFHRFVGSDGLGKDAAQRGGRNEAKYRLASLPLHYTDTRDYPSISSSLLSAHNHFGTVSIREVYYAGIKRYGRKAIHDEGGFIRQLWWRDFNGHLMAAFEDLYGVDPWEFEGSSAYRGKKSEKEKDLFDAWCKGETGHEFVDAGMKQLLTTGYIHNRVRMVCASWLVKDAGVWWRWGERWFASHLVDYDPAQNLMNWIGMSSLAPFGSAPFRRHDPERSQQRFDASREYVDQYLG